MPTALVTGANRGIGLQLCKQLKEQAYTVIAACRSSSPELDALEVRTITDVDVGSDQSIDTLCEKIGDDNIDLLINCAGILKSNTLSNLDWDSIRAQFEINSLGPLRVTGKLLKNLSTGSKVAIITSRMGSVADNDSGGQYGYRMSKAAVNMAGKSLAVDLKPKGIAVALLHPGYVRTDMTGGNGLIDSDESAAGLLKRINALNIDNTGSFWHQNGEALPW